MTQTCGNCGEPIEREYCPGCGQKRVASDHLINLESSLPRTVIGFLTRPGVVAREYVQGKRKAYIRILPGPIVSHHA